MAAPTKIMVIRHAEKPDDDDEGVNVEGQVDAESLIVQGWQRAGALVPFFAPTNGPLQNANLAVPNVIYASGPVSSTEDTADKKKKKKGSKSERPLETITPLAQRLSITPDTSFIEGDEKHMVESVLGQTGVVLICWQHEKIVKIAEHIVGSQPPTNPIPADWPGDRFDVVWLFTPPASSSDPWGFVQVPQQLLSGDTDTVISLMAPLTPAKKKS